MSDVRVGGQPVRRFILDRLGAHPRDIVRVTADHFGCSRQAVHKHLSRLVSEGAVEENGRTRGKTYKLASLVAWSNHYSLEDEPTEDAVWRRDILPLLDLLPGNVLNIWHHGFTEMFNNVIDHSNAANVWVRLDKTATTTLVEIYDDGVGIFKKIQSTLGLLDERHSVLELAKGKFTTDPANHPGEGIFFSSRMFDEFVIFSGEVRFSHDFRQREDWIVEGEPLPSGTLIRMMLDNHTARTTKKVFDRFTSDEDYAFDKTIVPVRLMRYGDDQLVSRSQAKRLVARVDRFKIVILDFAGVATVGQAFADEVFRDFRAKHPSVELLPVNTSSEVKRMITRAESSGERGLS